MRSFQETRIMHYDASLIKDIILDVEKYPEFLPWCDSAKILSRESDFFTAELAISFKNFSEKYVSKITKEENNDVFSIKVEAISGPFSHLFNQWSIKKQKNGTKVHFSIDFEFKSRILDTVIGFLFVSKAQKIAVAFEKRAKDLSGI